jgi:hypothetical protein
VSRRLTLLLLAGVLILSPSCGSGDDDGEGEASAAEVEQALRKDLASGSGDRAVDLGTSPPKLVTCEKDADGETGWRCTVVAASGRNIVCIVQSQPGDGVTIRRVCAPVDN